ncbi:MAG TPA: hypothetical protein VJ842_10805 [Pyrinomonadaceae bacterium]|nr:hypothetical protein [Pyrinomonadaceae bacterium]
MPRSHARTTYLFISVLTCVVVAACVVVAVTAAASQSNIPAKLSVLSGHRTLGVREQTQLRIKLLDQSGNEIAAPSDTSVTIIATRQRDIDTAKRDGKGVGYGGSNGTLTLPGNVNTVQTIIKISRGQSAAALQFSSHQAGTVRIYAENERLVTGATLIAFVVRTGRAAPDTRRMTDAAIFQKASFQERRPATPAAAPIAPPAPATAAATDYQLQIDDLGLKKSDLLGNKVQLRRLIVSLKPLKGDCQGAPQKIEVNLISDKDHAKFSEDYFVIPKGECAYPIEGDKFIELRTDIGGNIEVVAKVRPQPGISVKSSPATKLEFETTIRATKLVVTAAKPGAAANGIERVELTIQPMDDGNRMISCDEEGLNVRDIRLRVDNWAPGIKLESETKPIQMKRGEKFIVTSVTGSCPVGAKIVAEAVNADSKPIWGEKELVFCFPWTQLGSAMLGGLMFPLMLMIPGKQREERLEGSKLKNFSLYVVAGLFLGGVAFVVVFFGAFGLSEFNFNGLPVKIAQLPAQFWPAAIVIGFLGATMLVKGIPFKERAAKSEPAGGESDGSESGGDQSPAQA